MSLDPKLVELYQQLVALENDYSRNKICYFRPNPQSVGQNQFFKDQLASIRLVLGDNRSGKSVCGVVEAVSHSLGYRPWLPESHPDRIVRLRNGNPIPVPNIGRVVAQNYKQAVKQNIIEKFKEWAPKGWYTIKKDTTGTPVEINWSNGSVIYLMSNEQKDDSAFEGTNGHWFWADEPLDYSKYVGLRRGLIDFGGHCWLTLTPLTQPWIADVIESRGNMADGAVKVYRFKIIDNIDTCGGFLSQQDVDEFIADLRPEERLVRVGGEWAHLTGRVYKEWRAEPPYWVEPFEIPETWPRVCIIDPHPNKPVAVMWAAVNPDNQWHVYRELFDDSLRTIADVADEIKRLESQGSSKEHIVIRVIDSSSQEKERTSGYSVFTKFTAEGLPCIKAPKKNANMGYDAIHEALKIRKEWHQPMLVIFNTCSTVRQNFMRFSWDSWATDKLRDSKGERQTVRKIHDDFIDTIRYIFQSGLSYQLLYSSLNKSLEREFREGFDVFANKRRYEEELWQTF